ncbi:MAG: hypothetical protein COX80_02505 [Candidatus Magasanikbacteria bacterium CG_4_10_14_0_2_um_filter_33_14]|uniref:EF-hand domain-containing protein n=1 Tax=Candidatus Magasanikbacteria bacterium CG_4_10_14_0_2_um_filter_33_14 TaxID=1974636 RepID=A0A2M7VAT4_9BACT|nr:MAG: hypothetical protein COX80_02505 [Candidatus Magasanikbacteria bacterium CG_4_10_14_0_2_um_filter_33_14]
MPPEQKSKPAQEALQTLERQKANTQAVKNITNTIEEAAKQKITLNYLNKLALDGDIAAVTAIETLNKLTESDIPEVIDLDTSDEKFGYEEIQKMRENNKQRQEILDRIKDIIETYYTKYTASLKDAERKKENVDTSLKILEIKRENETRLWLNDVDKDKQMTLKEIDSTYGKVIGLWVDLIRDIKIHEGLSEDDFDITISFTELENGEAVKKVDALRKKLQEEKTTVEQQKETLTDKIRHLFGRNSKKETATNTLSKKIDYLYSMRTAIENFQKEYAQEKRRLENDKEKQKELEQQLHEIENRLTLLQKVAGVSKESSAK